MSKTIPLTRYIEVSSSSHIVYFFENERIYLENLMAYIKTGLEQGQHLIIIEQAEVLNKALQKMNVSEAGKKYIHHYDNSSFYRSYGDFNIESILNHAMDLIQPFLDEDVDFRTWSHVKWKDQKDIANKLDQYEGLADGCIGEVGYMCVCAYDATNVSAEIQTNLMRSHEYIMTDEEFVHSSLYNKKRIQSKK
ncbi:hypothetical protein GMD78_05845 [Ornithinibacillus sp. L9]|uniref:MEDS domain-containing protein n=1 Tax=Ornithinibacillus caprae TaxID=2678566 RepID=A0A6N8FEF5_9BACI|nr:MEDS domain-containing protein [Ornithinibacillus caprae]MUK87920.1 hypothetical protein [Ornithinibacillus caprae]